jgi:hypothetical membrane protein
MRRPHSPWLLTGAVGPLVFVINVVLGGLITPDYSHLRHAVSELTQAGAPNTVPLSALFVGSALSMLVFGVVVHRRWRVTRPRVATGGVLIAAYALQAVLLATVFPQDPIGAPMTFPGIMHLVIVGTSALCIVGALLLIGAGWDPGSHGFRRYSWASLAVMLLSGASTGILVSYDIQLLGLVERITQLAYLQWFTVFSLMAWTSPSAGAAE